MTTHYSYLDTPVGRLLLVESGSALQRIEFPKNGRQISPEPDWEESDHALRTVREQLREYFDGKREEFDLELELTGTPFQLRVWNTLEEIPYGETISYGELATRVGNPKASRAVGTANGKNPIPIVIPCHRVIGSNGTLTGFGGGLPTKEALLQLERARLGEQMLF